jgi:hypothetical protein
MREVGLSNHKLTGNPGATNLADDFSLILPLIPHELELILVPLDFTSGFTLHHIISQLLFSLLQSPGVNERKCSLKISRADRIKANKSIILNLFFSLI